MASAKEKIDQVHCEFTQEDARTVVHVECTFDHVERTERDQMEVQLPGNDLATMTQGPERVEQRNERVMVEIQVQTKGAHGAKQNLVLAAEDFQTVVEAVRKVLPDGVQARYQPIPPPYY